jgi:hypothetical protein
MSKFCGFCGNKTAAPVDTGRPVLYTKAGSKITPYGKFGVGKKMSGAIFMHRDEAKKLGFLSGIPSIPKEYNLVKLHGKRQGVFHQIDFVASPDFDSSPEPILADRIHYDKNTKETKHGQHLVDPYVIHHKWLLVKPNYKGFSYNKAIARSKRILNAGYQTNRVERKSLWDDFLKSHKL